MIGRSVAEKFKDSKILSAGRTDFMLEDTEFVQKYEESDIIMNFTGAPVVRRWTDKGRNEIRNSRIDTSRKLGLIPRQGKKKKRWFVSASAIGIYSDEGRHTEASKAFSSGFMLELIHDWENEVSSVKNDFTRLAILRIGIVLGKSGGFLKRLLPLYKMGLGGIIGHGRQGISWIHIKDLTDSVQFICSNNLEGVFNLCAPEPATNREFNATLGKVLKRPAFFRVPGWALRMVYGKGTASILTGGPFVIPERLQKEGYKFTYTKLELALRDIVN
jgi:uncharacterized protein (TIGR01777 family)